MRIGHRDLYLIPPQKLQACGLQVVVPAKSLVAAVSERSRVASGAQPLAHCTGALALRRKRKAGGFRLRALRSAAFRF